MISLVIPAYNESAVIGQTVSAAVKALSALTAEWELIVVDDGSTDKTSEEARCKDARVDIISYSPNRGKGYAVKTGIMAAHGDLVFFTDADLAYGLDVIGRAIEVFEKTGADAVIGSRRLDKEAMRSYPLTRRVTSAGFAIVSRVLSGMKYDTQCGFKGFRRETARKVFSECREERYAFDFEIMLLCDFMGANVRQMPVRIINHGSSKVNIILDGLRMARSVLCIRRSIEEKRHGAEK